MAKKKIPARQQYAKKKENKFIDMPKDQLIKVCVIAAIVIIGIVLFFVLRDKFDGHLDVVDSLPVTESDNWLVANTGTAAAPRYYKIGEIGEAEGYSREYEAASRMQNMTCLDESLHITTAYVITANGEYDTLSENVRDNLTSYITDAVVGDVDQSDINGHPARAFSCEYTFPVTDPQTGEATGTVNYNNGYYAYLKASRGQSVLVYASSAATDEAELASMETLKAEALKIAGAVTIDK